MIILPATMTTDVSAPHAVIANAPWLSTGAMLPWLLVLAAVVASTLAAWSLARRGTHGASSGHLGSYRRIARGIGLTGGQRRVLRRLARHAGLDAPAALLVSRGCFEHAVEVASSPTTEVDALRRTIFGSGDGPHEPDASA